ncbi:prolipoprotein diacylglyceryl transferase [Paenibacillus sp. MBLB2552]|uniref:Prolipoprotein diacylglyceryl transferase n=1 Tax=Paenibacillus mellifer TaxID=2937794 RepID=A0A9X1XWT5_9BACL|nr:prolipoprotein diacylglyceryl transferase family protein [Paenibacillus mellifer]MCK8486732.1 prolipoprotein diacylglyceryl transferase [Paenibacillus mellifer]
MGLAVLLAVGVAYFLARGTQYQKHIYNLVFYVLIGAILGARIWHVFFFNGDIIRNIYLKSSRFGMGESQSSERSSAVSQPRQFILGEINFHSGNSPIF